ncbi:hypothetical protein KY285_000867 [Solanum tuberosum]|nr:hypothetical protein KY285_000867 [Solanum tuberosum]
MRVKLSSRVLNEVANEPSVYQKVTLVSIPYRRWSIVRRCTSFLKMCRASGNLEALYIKGVFDFFNRNDPTALGMINQAADGGHIGASYVECGCQNLICWEEDPFVALFINLSKSDAGMVGPWEATMKMIFIVIYVVVI